MMLHDRIRQATTTYLGTLPFSDKEIWTDLPIRFGVLGVNSVADYVVCDVSYFVVIILCEVPTTKHAVLEAREHLKSILSATDTQFGVLATGTDPESWFFSENCRNNWFIEIPRSVFESRVARWHPDMRRSPSMLNLQERVRASNNIAQQRLKELRKWRRTAIGFGIGFLGIGLLLIWYLLK
ncbi:hypothetical protein C6500_11730 [Candidatus Poribacteria bacterium]|nr:MAG: hypothetical protein C6500_11730 [Candidatus Poribacteria bacterium]